MMKCKFPFGLLLLLITLGCGGGRRNDDSIHTRSKDKEFKIMSYNILQDNPNRPVGYSWAERKERLIALLKNYKPDILCAQEDYYGQGLEIIQATGWEKTGVAKNTGTPTGSGECVGIYYDSNRFLLKKNGHFWLSPTPTEPTIGWDASTTRICNWAHFVDIYTENHFFVFNLHADHIGAKSRIESFKLVLDEIASIAGEMPVILAGDFNATKNTEEIQILLDKLRFARDISEKQPLGPLATRANLDGDPPTRLLDYIFVSNKFQVLEYRTIDETNEEGLYPSDHFPVLSVLVQQ